MDSIMQQIIEKMDWVIFSIPPNSADVVQTWK